MEISDGQIAPSRSAPKACQKQCIYEGIRNRELGFDKYFGGQDEFIFRCYNSLDKHTVVQDDRNKRPEELRKYGGIFNLEFSLDGRILVAACEEKSILLYDASNQRLVKAIPNAHSNCVNCVKFLNHRTFATCSDDNSTKLWDLRNLKTEIRQLHGHSNWVKNIEYSERENIMVTAAFDGGIYAWNLNNKPDDLNPYDKLFLMNGMMRTKLSPDGSKMVISTTSGFMIIIHDLDLNNLANDIKSFKPDLYRLMQRTEQNFPVGNIYTFLFHPSRQRNRIEFIDDFPNRAEVISSLEIHPHGWSALSRNINASETEDWTSVHDIQSRSISEYTKSTLYVEEDWSETEPIEAANPRPTDLWIGCMSNEDYSASVTLVDFELPTMSTVHSGLIGENKYDRFFQKHPEYKNKIAGNIPRLTHYIEERNAGKGYIKEVCFSRDGRVICSPYANGIRLLGFNDKCQELTYCVPDSPRELSVVAEMENYHSGVVVCCKFSPVHMQLVSGCLSGDIVWYQPIL